jgi:hypothetical protein
MTLEEEGTMSFDCCRPTHKFEDGAYNASQVRLYGILSKIEELEKRLVLLKLQQPRKDARQAFGGLVIKVKKGLAVVFTLSDPGAQMSVGVIFGYAYEGHCYELPKPKVMVLPVNPEMIPKDDCGFDEKAAEDYMVWVVDKLDECIEIEVSSGFVEQLVLEANLPGKRSPTTYRAAQALAHRGGRLTD